MTLLLFYVVLVIAVSFICSLLESVMLSISPAYIAVLVKEGKRSGKLLEKLCINIDQPLAAILTVNTLANTVGATGVGAQVLIVYGDGFLAIASTGLAFAILVLSEILPKTIGALYWKKLAPVAGYMVNFLIGVTYPMVFLSRKVYQIFGTRRPAQTTREEMIVTAEISANEGVIHHKESRVIRNLLMLDKIAVSEVMTPRTVLTAYNQNDTVGHLMETHKPIRFSRIPLYDGSLDSITGLLHRYKLMEAVSHDLDSLTLKELRTPIHTVPENVSVSAALDQFIKRQEHLFLVIDDYGVPAGIVTLEDTIETLLGVEIIDESDDVADMRQYALDKWREKKNQQRGLKD